MLSGQVPAHRAIDVNSEYLQSLFKLEGLLKIEDRWCHIDFLLSQGKV